MSDEARPAATNTRSSRTRAATIAAGLSLPIWPRRLSWQPAYSPAPMLGSLGAALLFFPRQQYPQTGHGGSLERFDPWDDVHE